MMNKMENIRTRQQAISFSDHDREHQSSAKSIASINLRI